MAKYKLKTGSVTVIYTFESQPIIIILVVAVPHWLLRGKLDLHTQDLGVIVQLPGVVQGICLEDHGVGGGLPGRPRVGANLLPTDRPKG